MTGGRAARKESANHFVKAWERNLIHAFATRTKMLATCVAEKETIRVWFIGMPSQEE